MTERDTVLPYQLKRGDRIAVISPAGPVRDREALDRGMKRLTTAGYRPELLPHALESTTAEAGQFLAGDDVGRHADLQAAMDRPEYRAIWCTRGGYGCTRILERIDWSKWRKDPKPLIGYSDVTALLAAAWAETSVVGFHGPMVGTSTALATGETLEQHQLALVTEPERARPWPTTPAFGRVLRAGAATGPLVGGNLSLVCALLGTPWQIKTDGALLFLEDIGEAPYRLDRMLVQLRQAGCLRRIAGLLLGDFHLDKTPWGSVQDGVVAVLRDHCSDLNVPVAYAMPFGHRPQSWTLPFGQRARLDTSKPDRPPRFQLSGPSVRPR